MSDKAGGRHVVTTTRTYKGKTYRSHLLRRSYREDGQVKKETLANLTPLGDEVVGVIRRALRGEKLVSVDEVFKVVEDGSPRHGDVEAVLLTMKRLGFEGLIASRGCPERTLIVALVVARILEPGSKLATSRWWHSTTLPAMLGLGDADEDDIYAAMDWLYKRQDKIEKKLAARHLDNDALALYDLSSSYFEGVTCPLAKRGHSRDGKKDRLQVNYGLLTNAGGIPVAVSVFDGNTGDPKTLLPQVEKMRRGFGLQRFVVVGDRGMITQKQIDVLKDVDGIDWITALRGDTIAKLVKDEAIQPSLFDECNLFEISHLDYPGERLVACRNPALAARRARKRQALLEATVEELEKVRRMTAQDRLIGKAAIGAHMAKILTSRKVGQHIRVDVRDDGFDFSIDQEKVTAAATCGLVKELEKVRRRIERGRLSGKVAIGERVHRALDARQIGRHVTAAIRADGFDFSIDQEQVVAAATRALVKQLDQVRRRIGRGRLHGKDNIGVRVGRVLNKYKVGKHFVHDIRDDGFDFSIDREKVAAEAALDGIYVIRTSVAKERLDSAETVRSYKLLTQVERAFRCFKAIALKLRPIFHNLEIRVRTHIFICMLAYYLEWHMIEAWRPLLFCDEDQAAKASRDPVALAKRSAAALRKVHSRRLDDGSVVHSFHTLLDHLGERVRNTCRRIGAPPDEPAFHMTTPANPKQQKAYDLLHAIQL